MNLQEFISYKEECPFCKEKLILYFLSKKKQPILQQNGRIMIFYEIGDVKKITSTHKVGFSFGLNDNSLFIEFYDKNGLNPYYDYIPDFLMKKFKELYKNIVPFTFYKVCQCNRYAYNTGYFSFNFKNSKIEDLNICSEYFGMIDPLPDGNFIISKMVLDFKSKETSFTYSKEASPVWARNDSKFHTMNFIRIPGLINFTTEKDLLERFRKLIIFS